MLFFQFYWCLPVEIAVSAVEVVVTFDVFEHRVRQLDSGIPALSVQQFHLHAPSGGRQINSQDTQTAGSVVSKSQAAGRHLTVSQS